MRYRYYRGEHCNPYVLPDETRSSDPRSRYWFTEQFVCANVGGRTDDFTKAISGYPCRSWSDYLRRAKVDLSARGLAFEIDFQNFKFGGGECEEDWYSYFDGPRLRWQNVPFDLPEEPVDWGRFKCVDRIDGHGYKNGKLISFGPIVGVTYRGVADVRYEEGVPVFEIENLRGDRLHVVSPGYAFRYGDFAVSGRIVNPDGSEDGVYVYDRRLHVALARLILDNDVPAVCAGERLRLPSIGEVGKEMRWYRLPERTNAAEV